MKGKKRTKRYRKMKLKKKECWSVALKIECYNRMTDVLSTPEQLPTLSILPKFTSTELFRQHTLLQTHTYPSSFSLIRPLSYVSSSTITVDQLTGGNFPTLMYTIEELVRFSVMLLEDNGFAANRFSQKTISSLCEAIAMGYNRVSYHNFSHAFALSQLCHYCLSKQADLRQEYSAEEYFYVMIAGLAHDINHQGTNNHFEVKKRSILAVQFNNQSVLENMHIKTLWNILSYNPAINFLDKASNPKQAKQTITRLILATDMSYHCKKVDSLKNRRIEGSLKSDKWFIMETLFHACDIGNPTSSYENYISWAALLSYQFNQQATLEKKLGLEVSQSFIYQDISTLYKDQIWFVGNLVHPLWKELSLTWSSWKPLVQQIESNQSRVQSQLERLRN